MSRNAVNMSNKKESWPGINAALFKPPQGRRKKVKKRKICLFQSCVSPGFYFQSTPRVLLNEEMTLNINQRDQGQTSG